MAAMRWLSAAFAVLALGGCDDLLRAAVKQADKAAVEAAGTADEVAAKAAAEAEAAAARTSNEAEAAVEPGALEEALDMAKEEAVGLGVDAVGNAGEAQQQGKDGGKTP
jgi:hypothetical protein